MEGILSVDETIDSVRRMTATFSKMNTIIRRNDARIFCPAYLLSFIEKVDTIWIMPQRRYITLATVIGLTKRHFAEGKIFAIPCHSVIPLAINDIVEILRNLGVWIFERKVMRTDPVLVLLVSNA